MHVYTMYMYIIIAMLLCLKASDSGLCSVGLPGLGTPIHDICMGLLTRICRFTAL